MFRVVDGVRAVDLRSAGNLALVLVGSVLLPLRLQHRSFPHPHLRAGGLRVPATLATMAVNVTCLGAEGKQRRPWVGGWSGTEFGDRLRRKLATARKLTNPSTAS